jgi:hypothetical protein
MEKDDLYFLKISGFIRNDKQREFQQTVQFIINHLPPQCLESHLTADVFIPDQFHFFTTWNSEAALNSFNSSEELELLKGAFYTLGSFQSTVTGSKTEGTVFHLKQT